MGKQSAGILLYKFEGHKVKILLAHMGGPFWAKKDDGAWTIPKGEFEEEDALAAAKREFNEEIGPIPDAEFEALEPIKQKSGKTVFAWVAQADFDPVNFKSNFFEMEWPPRSGRFQKFPEVDKIGWFDLDVARAKMVSGQDQLIDQLEKLLA